MIKLGAWLLVGSISLGLIGTIVGMMLAFGRISNGGHVAPSEIADEISVALISTAAAMPIALAGIVCIVLGLLKRGDVAESRDT